MYGYNANNKAEQLEHIIQRNGTGIQAEWHVMNNMNTTMGTTMYGNACYAFVAYRFTITDGTAVS